MIEVRLVPCTKCDQKLPPDAVAYARYWIVYGCLNLHIYDAALCPAHADHFAIDMRNIICPECSEPMDSYEAARI